MSLFSPLLCLCFFLFLAIRRPPTPTLLPYTTLFRSRRRPRPSRARAGGRRNHPRPERAPAPTLRRTARSARSEEHTSELQSPCNLVCRLLLEKKKNNNRLVTRTTSMKNNRRNRT